MIELSVIIPTYNRANLLRRCLEALFCQTQPLETYEIVVVVDGSTDGTREMLAGLKPPCTLRVFYQANAGVGAARNHGIAQACGRYCLFLDDDIIADRGLVMAHLLAHHAGDGRVVLGHLEIALPRSADGFA